MYLWLHRCLAEDGEITQAAIEDNLETSGEQAFAAEYLDMLVRKDAVTESGDSYLVADADAERDAYYQLLDTESSDYERPEELSYEPVINVPTGLQRAWDDAASETGVSPGVDLESALRTVIEDADESLSITAPFFDRGGLNLLTEALTDAARRGVVLKVLSREIAQPARDSYSINSRRKALAEMINRYENAGDETASIEVRSYHRDIGESDTKLDRSIHTKLVIADTTTAYVGSGEIRGNSMNLLAEGGYLTGNSEDIQQWLTFFNFVWERATPVSHTELME